MGRSQSKHEDVAAAPHMHRNPETSKSRDTKPSFHEQALQAHSSIQPSTSKAVRKSPTVGEASINNVAKKKRLIPKIIVTGPSEELLINSITDVLPETKTIRDTEDYGPYNVHTKPSTVDAYKTTRDQ